MVAATIAIRVNNVVNHPGSTFSCNRGSQSWESTSILTSILASILVRFAEQNRARIDPALTDPDSALNFISILLGFAVGSLCTNNSLARLIFYSILRHDDMRYIEIILSSNSRVLSSYFRPSCLPNASPFGAPSARSRSAEDLSGPPHCLREGFLAPQKPS
jgi:hypothetical protein